MRSQQWWDHKVPPVIAVAALALGARPGPARAADLGALALLVCSVLGVAAFGHLVNDWADVEADARGDKANQLTGRPWSQRLVLVGTTLAVGLAPWFWLPSRPRALGALGTEVALLVVYSVPPVRLKARGWAGAACDAAYAYGLPFLIAALAFGPGGVTGHDGRFLVVLGALGLLVGLRGILSHQLDDIEADRAAGTGTVARRFGVERTERLLADAFLPIELAAWAAVVALAGVAWLPWLVLAYVIYRTFQVTFLWTESLTIASLRQPRRRVEAVGFDFANDFLERWLPLAALVALAVRSPWWWVAVGGHLVLFRTALRTFLAWDLWAMPDALERVAFAHRARRDIQEMARRRAVAVAAGPAPLEDPTARRWVFVVCGPGSHIHTLATAVRHLRPVTAAEIYVVTDPARNAVPIDAPGVDRVVEVATPPELDDHQASIWLKTSIHRHLPAGEWCYLDSDIIAVAPGVEELFDHRRGPVAFASDSTIRENSVDRFSPWAMTCDCLGYDDQHSCGHLREQLRARFDVAVPGDWLHWNGGVFAFGPEAAPVLDLWHERAVASFAWPEWKTRDQGALIATAWTLGLADLPRLPPAFNFIADLGNSDLCLDPERGWALHPAGPWSDARFLHLYTSPLEDPGWDLGRDVEAVVLRASRVRRYRFERSQVRSRVMALARVRMMRLRRLPRRLTPARLQRALLVRLGRDGDGADDVVSGPQIDLDRPGRDDHRPAPDRSLMPEADGSADAFADHSRRGA